MAKVVVTGAFGFIGGAVIEQLATDHGIVASSRTQRSCVAQWGVRKVNYDSVPSLEALVAGADVVVHLADTAGREGSQSHTSAETARKLGHAMASKGVRRLIFASSLYARLAAEGQDISYGADKLAAEKVFAANTALCPVFLRFPPVYGPGGRGGFATLARLVSKGIPLPIGAAHAPRDYISRENVVDLIAALVALNERSWDQLSGQAYEPCDGQPLSTRDLAVMIGQVLGRQARHHPIPPTLMRLAGWISGKPDIISGIFDPLLTIANPNFDAVINWQPKTQMPDSLAFLKGH